jgi:probable rRNA maturation factor
MSGRAVHALLFSFCLPLAPRWLYGETLSGRAMVILQKCVAGLDEDSLDRFVTRAKRAARLRGSVTVLVTSSKELRRLNSRFRGTDKPTDVLSFLPDVIARRRFAGDVAISAEIAAQNARSLGHSPAEEVKILTLHGVLHLAGYDHERDSGEMARREARLRRQLGLPMALTERGESSVAKGLNRRVREGTPQPERRQAAGVGPRGSGRNARGRSR